MRVRLIPAVGVVVVLAFLLSLSSPAIMAQVKAPADFSYPPGKGSPGAVTFGHEIHGKKEAKCTACHTKVFKMKKFSDKIDMATLNNGKSCGTCHNGKVAFSTSAAADCAKCHKKG